jgi:hypothetical protein
MIIKWYIGVSPFGVAHQGCQPGDQDHLREHARALCRGFDAAARGSARRLHQRALDPRGRGSSPWPRTCDDLSPLSGADFAFCSIFADWYAVVLGPIIKSQDVNP